MNSKKTQNLQCFSGSSSCEVDCNVITDLQNGISSLISNIGTSSDCISRISGLSGTSGISICPNTMFGELNKISLGVSDIRSLFGETNNCFDNSNDCYGNIFGILNGINHNIADVSDQINKKIGDCGDCGTSTICEKLNISDSLLSSIDAKTDAAISNLNSIEASIGNCATPICTQLGIIGKDVKTIETNVNTIGISIGGCATPICTQLGAIGTDVNSIEINVNNIGTSIGDCGTSSICTRLGDLGTSVTNIGASIGECTVPICTQLSDIIIQLDKIEDMISDLLMPPK